MLIRPALDAKSVADLPRSALEAVAQELIAEQIDTTKQLVVTDEEAAALRSLDAGIQLRHTAGTDTSGVITLAHGNEVVTIPEAIEASRPAPTVTKTDPDSATVTAHVLAIRFGEHCCIGRAPSGALLVERFAATPAPFLARFPGPGGGVPVRWRHDSNTNLGHVIDLVSDGDALWAELQLSTVVARDALELAATGSVRAVSIGFTPTDDDERELICDGLIERITRHPSCRLAEISLVEQGAYATSRVDELVWQTPADADKQRPGRRRTAQLRSIGITPADVAVSRVRRQRRRDEQRAAAETAETETVNAQRLELEADAIAHRIRNHNKSERARAQARALVDQERDRQQQVTQQQGLRSAAIAANGIALARGRTPRTT